MGRDLQVLHSDLFQVVQLDGGAHFPKKENYVVTNCFLTDKQNNSWVRLFPETSLHTYHCSCELCLSHAGRRTTNNQENIMSCFSPADSEER